MTFINFEEMRRELEFLRLFNPNFILKLRRIGKWQKK